MIIIIMMRLSKTNQNKLKTFRKMKKNNSYKLILKHITQAYITLLVVISVILLSNQMVLENISYNGISGSSGMAEIDGQISRSADDSLNEDDAYITSDMQFNIPDFEVSLKPMGRLNRKNHILYPEDASSYIIPENEVVKWYANNTILTDTALLWKHNNNAVKFNYKTDNDLFNNPPDDDFWQNPDYYLTHDNVGDCEDFSLAFASILEAKGISAEIVGVRLINGQYHWIVRYDFNGHTRYADINRNDVVIFQDSDPMIDKEWVVIDKDSIKVLQ